MDLIIILMVALGVQILLSSISDYLLNRRISPMLIIMGLMFFLSGIFLFFVVVM